MTVPKSAPTTGVTAEFMATWFLQQPMHMRKVLAKHFWPKFHILKAKELGML